MLAVLTRGCGTFGRTTQRPQRRRGVVLDVRAHLDRGTWSCCCLGQVTSWTDQSGARGEDCDYCRCEAAPNAHPASSTHSHLRAFPNRQMRLPPPARNSNLGKPNTRTVSSPD